MRIHDGKQGDEKKLFSSVHSSALRCQIIMGGTYFILAKNVGEASGSFPSCGVGVINFNSPAVYFKLEGASGDT